MLGGIIPPAGDAPPEYPQDKTEQFNVRPNDMFDPINVRSEMTDAGAREFRDLVRLVGQRTRLKVQTDKNYYLSKFHASLAGDVSYEKKNCW